MNPRLLWQCLGRGLRGAASHGDARHLSPQRSEGRGPRDEAVAIHRILGDVLALALGPRVHQPAREILMVLVFCLLTPCPPFSQSPVNRARTARPFP